MIRLSQVFIFLLFLSDITLLGVAWIGAYFMRFDWYPVPAPDYIPELQSYIYSAPIIIAVAAFGFISSGIYKNLLRSKHEMIRVLQSCLVIFATLLAVSFFYRDFSFSRIFALHFIWMSFVLISIERTLARKFLAYMRKKGKNLLHVLVIGNHQTAIHFCDKITHNKELGLQFHGTISKSKLFNIQGLPWLGDYASLPEIVEKHGIQQVYIALDSKDQSDLDDINYFLRDLMVDLFHVPDVYHSLNINPEILDLDGIPLVALRQSPLSGWNSLFKRIFDIFGALVGIILLSPFFIVISLLVKMTSKGPVLYAQERMGLDGTRFNMLKFRSMPTNAESSTGAVWAKKGDNRTTAIGGFLRKSSLDEIPQFFNVLGGSMSLVGPRPERPVFIEEFKGEIPNYMLRHKMKAGMSGWAQVNGWRGNTSLEKRIECDIYYLTNWSIWFDIKIVLLTLIRGFVNPNAY